MAVIYKYPIPHPAEAVAIPLPIGAKILSVALMSDRPYVWCEVDPGAALEPHPFAAVNTGRQAPSGLHFRGTLISSNGFVSHIYIGFEAPVAEDG